MPSWWRQVSDRPSVRLRLAIVLAATAMLLVVPPIAGLRHLWIGFWAIALFLPVGLVIDTWPGRLFRLGRASLALLLVFSVRPLDLRPEFKVFGASPTLAPAQSEVRELGQTELGKAIKEIESRAGQEDTWFKYKFGLIGALLVGVTFFKLGYRTRTGAREDAGTRTITELWHSPASCVALAVACVAALACDIHVRGNMCVTNQLGLWIAHFAEPALSGQPFEPANVDRFIPWEQFLRSDLGSDRDAGMHNGELWSLTFWPHFHYLTAMIYLLYAITFQDLCLHRQRWNLQQADDKVGPLVILLSFVFVHFAFAMLTWVAHAAPSAFEYRIIPFVEDSSRSGVASPLFYLVAWGGLAWQQWKYAARLLPVS